MPTRLVTNLETGETVEVELTPEEMALTSPQDPNAEINAQIRELEFLQERLLTPRARREFFLGLLAALNLNPAANPGTAALLSIQSQIVALRSQRV